MKETLKKLNTATVLFVITLLGITQNIKAANPGSLDPSFGIAGKAVLVNSNFSFLNMTDIAVQDDGKIIAVGSQNNTPKDFVIIRCLNDGTLDDTFSGDGIAVADFGNTDENAASVAIQMDGKYVVFGDSGTQLAIARFLPNGNLDTTFDTDGKKTLPGAKVGSDGEGSVAIKSDGKIVIGGSSINTGSPADFVLFQLTPDGSLDLSFDADGKVITDLDGFDELHEIKLQTDGKIVAVGSATSKSKSAIVRYNTNGSLDTTFSGDGILINDFYTDSSFEYLTTLAINPTNNSIIAVGVGNIFKLQVYRILSNGNFDTTFSGDGRFEMDFHSDGNDVAIQSDGKIVVAGSKLTSNGDSFNSILVVRINTVGNLDSSFGNNGFELLLVNANPNVTMRKSIALKGDKLTIGGRSFIGNSMCGFARINLSITPSQSGDFDGDGVGDIAVYRPSQGLWIILKSSDNSVVFKQFGLNGDIPIDGDFDGDGKNDFAIYRPSEGLWFVEKSSDGTNFARQFGTNTDEPVTDDYDKDGKTDIAFFRPSSGEWFVLRSSDGFNTFFSFPFGANGDIPIVKKGP